MDRLPRLLPRRRAARPDPGGRRQGDPARPESAGQYVVTTGELQSGAQGLSAPVRGVAGLEASVGVVTLGGGIDEGVVAPRVLAAAESVRLALAGDISR